MTVPVLEVTDLDVAYRGATSTTRAAQGVTLRLTEGRILGLVGESGSGKSTVAKAILHLLPPNGVITGGSIRFKGTDITALPDDAFRRFRWKGIAYIPQNALSALDPVLRVGRQMDEAIYLHEDAPRPERARRIAAALEGVHLDPAVTRAFPHQLSGGMRQRVLIAMALLLAPPVIVVDEPTTALDVLSQREVLNEIKRLRTTSGSAMLYVSHDLGVVRDLCDEVMVMYAGRVVEQAPAATLFMRPSHPFTMGLIYAVPKTQGASALISIPGSPPDLRHALTGCPFRPRCPFAVAACTKITPEFVATDQPSQSAACVRVAEASALRAAAARSDTWDAVAARGAAV